MFKKSLKLIHFVALSLLLMSFQCDDEIASSIEYNTYKVQIASKASFSTNDTIWITGKVSSKAFDTVINDSIFNNDIQANQLAIFKFITPTEFSNAKDAIDSFELIYDIGSYSFLPICENAQVSAMPVLNSAGTFYTYRLGLKPKFSGDYIVSFLDGAIQNIDKNIAVAENYSIERYPNQLGFLKCTNVSWLNIDDSTREIIFSVE